MNGTRTQRRTARVPFPLRFDRAVSFGIRHAPHPTVKRIPEPELMDDRAQAQAYAAADFSVPHEAFVDHFARLFPQFHDGAVLDLGCGPADVTLRFARRFPAVRVTGIDGAEAMLAPGRQAIEAAGLGQRIELVCCHLPTPPNGQQYDAIICNSLLHHLADPGVLWRTIKQSAAPGAPVLVMDLMRPDSRGQADVLTQQYAAGDPPILQRDFYNSLCAAYTPDEVRAQLRSTVLGQLEVAVVSDRHWLAWGTMRD
jgi:SAM-dependent methyltransferase